MMLPSLFRSGLVLTLAAFIAAFAYWNSLGLKQGTLPNGSQFDPVSCWFENTSSLRVDCGYMTTRHLADDDAAFKLPVVVIRDSLWKNSNAPMLHISGGPGGAAYIDAETMPFWLENFQAQKWGVDFVLYDQRGSGLSQPFLDCPNTKNAQLKNLRLPLTAAEASLLFSALIQQCYEQLSKDPLSATHLTSISTRKSSEDIADLHELLSVKQWVLMGVSYGTRLALDFVSEFPDKVHSLVLDSVYPPEFDGFKTMVENGFQGVDKLLNTCEMDEPCDSRFPDVREQLKQSLNQLLESPLKLKVPRERVASETQEISLTAHRLISLLDYASYDSRLFADIPAAITAAKENDASSQSLLNLASNYLEIELYTQFSEPVYMVTECLENGGFSYQSLFERLQPYRKEYPMLDWSKQSIYNPAICRGWANDDKKMSKSYKKAVVTDKPTLILSGALDSITPADWGRQLSDSLPDNWYFEYPSAGHSVLTSALCANDEVQMFLNPNLKNTAFCTESEREQQRRSTAINWNGLNN
jgi:pimeloyl-ACP methyl ester carboxylesterase